jgi:hypothetical protein
VFGMLFATMLGIFVIPVFYVVLQRISERKMPFRAERETDPADDRQPGTAPPVRPE